MSGKINRKAVSWFLESELPELRVQELIPGECLDALERYYRAQARPESNGKLVTILLFSLGALLVMLGAALVIAHNWDEWPAGARLALGFTPLFIGAGLGFFTLWHNRGPAWREPAALIYGLGIAAALAVTMQVYPLGGEMKSLLLVWWCLLLPVPRLFRSFGALLLWLAVTAAWSMPGGENFRVGLTNFFLPLPPLAALAGLAGRRQDSLRRVWSRWLLTPAVLLYALPFFLESTFIRSDALFLALCAALTVFGCRLEARDAAGLIRNPLPALGFAAAYFPLLAACIGGLGRYPRPEWAPADRPAALLLTATAAVTVCTFCKPRNRWYPATLLPAVLLLLNPPGGAYWLTGAVLLLAALLFTGGIRRNSLLSLNGAMLLITGLIFAWFLESRTSILTRGILFIAAGLLIAGVNLLIWKRRRRQGGSHE